jgi:hypothetical protein
VGFKEVFGGAAFGRLLGIFFWPWLSPLKSPGPIKQLPFAGPPASLPRPRQLVSAATAIFRKTVSLFPFFVLPFKPQRHNRPVAFRRTQAQTTNANTTKTTMAALQAYRHLLRAARIAFEGTNIEGLLWLDIHG